MMIRKLLLPAIAVALLGGCMTGGYSYRQDRGDYYYGQPSTDYRHYGSPYGYGSGYYGRNYYPGYGYPYSGYPYYGSRYGHNRYPYGYYRPPLVVRPRPDDNDHRPDRDHDDDRKAPWRDYERLQRERVERSRSPVVQRPAVSVPARPARPVPRPAPVRARGNDGGSRMDRIMRRATDSRARPRKVEP
ncbi:MAG: hypothetical protein ACREPV_15250 [Lysobacter sp.]